MMRILRLIRNFAVLALILAFTGIAILLITHEGRVAIRAAMLVPEVLPGATFQPLRAISEPALVEDVRFPYSGGTAGGTMWRPAGPGQHGALILFLGVNPDYGHEPLRQFASAVARQGAVVLLVHGVELGNGRLSLAEVDGLVGAVRYVRELPYVNPKRVGFAGFCVGGSFALLAAGDPRIAADVNFVNAFGGFYSAETLLAAMTTQAAVVDNLTLQPWHPDERATSWFQQAVVNALSGAAERAEVERLLKAGTPLEPEQRRALTPRLRAIHDLLMNRDPSVFGPLYDGLPPDLRGELAKYAPANNFSFLQAKVFLMADANDRYIPHTESKLLNFALREYPRRVFTEFDFFDHMTPGALREGFDLVGEVWKLFSHVYLVLLELS